MPEENRQSNTKLRRPKDLATSGDVPETQAEIASDSPATGTEPDPAAGLAAEIARARARLDAIEVRMSALELSDGEAAVPGESR